MKTEFKKLDKIYKCLKSSKTIEQYNNSFGMLLMYSKHRPNNSGVVLFMTQIQDYAILKGKSLVLNCL
jgi:hypothetical protein